MALPAEPWLNKQIILFCVKDQGSDSMTQYVDPEAYIC